TQDVPHRLLDAAEGAGQDRAAAVEGMPVDRLPVVLDPARILPDQVFLDFLDSGLDRARPPLHHGLAVADQVAVGVHLQEEPPGADEERLQPRDLHAGAPFASSRSSTGRIMAYATAALSSRIQEKVSTEPKPS